MLCTAHRLHGEVTPDLDSALYRATHQNHPCAIWARATRDNYLWGYRLLVALCDEYTHRYGKVHATARLLPILATVPIGITDAGLQPFPQAMPDECKDTIRLKHIDAITSCIKQVLQGGQIVLCRHGTLVMITHWNIINGATILLITGLVALWSIFWPWEKKWVS